MSTFLQNSGNGIPITTTTTSQQNNSFSLRNFPDCKDLLKTPVSTASSSIADNRSSEIWNINKDKDLSQSSSYAAKFQAAKVSSWDQVAKGTNWDRSHRFSFCGNFRSPDEPLQKKRKPLTLEDMNKLKVPLVSEIPITDFTIFDEVLGQGSFGTVRRGMWSESEVAIKTMDSIYQDAKDIIKEVVVLRQISHQNIVSIMGVCHQESEFHILMELVNGHTLYDVIFKKNIKTKYNLTLQDEYVIAIKMCKAITFLYQHPLQVLHRDIKPGNVMLTLRDKDVKVCDLGLAKFDEINSRLRSTIGRSTPGTPIYMAPEITLFNKSASQFTDVWSLAATMTEFFSKHPLWKLNEGFERFNLTFLMKKKEMPSLLDVPLCLQGILIKCYNYEDIKRPTVKEILHSLNHIYSNLQVSEPKIV